MIFLSFKSLFSQNHDGLNRVNSNNFPAYFPLEKNDFIKISSPYGYRKHPINKKNCMHRGIDLVAKKGKPVYATAAGIVYKAKYGKGYGNYVVINHLTGIKTLYGHLWVNMVKKGENVEQGQLIGFVGDTGNVTGPHLHYEVWFKNKKVNPIVVWKNLLKETQEKIAINE